MLSCVTTKLVSCPERPLALYGPEDDTGEPAAESEIDGECRESLDAPTVALSACDRDDTPEMGEVTRGLLPEVTVRVREPEWEIADA
jgi:hypothetical protein